MLLNGWRFSYPAVGELGKSILWMERIHIADRDDALLTAWSQSPDPIL
ncbi:hypothetical protein Q3C01_23755 [Bradyrhizobium sp. UFLA05-109]